MRQVTSIVIAVLSLVLLSDCKQRKDEASLKADSEESEEACLFGGSSDSVYGSSGAGALDFLTWKISKSLALASNLAYLDQDAVEKQAKAWGYPKVDHFVHDTMYGFLMSNERCVVLTFRGTDMKSLSDWLVNAKASSKRLGNDGRVHEGFYDAESGFHRNIVWALSRAGASRKIFWVTGHSLGGALAGIFAYKSKFERWFGDGPEMHKIITFGQPIFSDGALAKKMRNTFVGKYYRVVNESDLVTRVPFWMTHFGSLVWLRNGRVDYRPDRLLAGAPQGSSDPEVMEADIPPDLQSDEAAYREFIEQTKNLPKGSVVPDTMRVMGGYGFSWPKFIDDHFMGNYIRRITDEVNEYR